LNKNFTDSQPIKQRPITNLANVIKLFTLRTETVYELSQKYAM